MQRYITLSLELHLFFARIMKEHSLFLEAGFTPKNKEYAEEAESFKNEFERLLSQVVDISNGNIRPNILNSGEIVTNFTLSTENKTENFTGIKIDTDITRRELALTNTNFTERNINMANVVRAINNQAINLVDGLIKFKEKILNDVLICKIFTANYPLLIDHILREANLYRTYIMALENNQDIETEDLKNIELFWNQIMMEHALFIRGLLDPTENDLINMSNGFAAVYQQLLKETENASDATMNNVTNKAIMETTKYRNFKQAGTKGIDSCQIRSIILPLLADHVLREANHYLRILNSAK